MSHPAGILTNTKTGRFHPIVFRMAPMPGNADARTSAQRYKSSAHHTDGFETKEEASAWIADHADKGFVHTGREYAWDGTGTPAMVEWFAPEEVILPKAA